MKPTNAKNYLDTLLRARQVVNPNGPVPISRSHWWELVRRGDAPQPVRMGRITAWRQSDIAMFLAERFK